jgi:hypothetical protein
MTEIGSRGKIGTGHGKLGFRSGCTISERRNTYSSAKTDHIFNWLLRVIANTNKTKSHRQTVFKEIPMECQRCLLGKEAKYRVYSDVLDMKVCAACADEARRLGIAVEALDNGKVKNNGTVCSALAAV